MFCAFSGQIDDRNKRETPKPHEISPPYERYLPVKHKGSEIPRRRH